jgi:predicted LPLAT superfamily acyltransferase
MTTARWAGRRERGSAALIRLMIWLSLNLGWPVGQALLYPITLYFLFILRAGRQASRGFLDRVLGRPATNLDVFRHFFSFSCVLLDRAFLLSNQLRHFDIKVTGLDDVISALALSRGCILLGSHLGSFEVLRIVARQSPVPVKILMYRGNARPYSRLVEALDPMLAGSIIEIGEPEAMLRVRESVEHGEIVGILADRAPQQDRIAVVPFLGDPAPFPTGPLILAAVLGTPVVLFFGIRTGNRRYEVCFEHFADRVILDRARRAEDLVTWTRRYAARLETYVQRCPFNWFNFYDFWERRTDA